MADHHLSVRLGRETFEHLQAESQRAGRPRAEIARTLLDEGLRMRTHPGIIFRSGPAGRRPGLIAGPDIWEVARVLKGIPIQTERAADLARATDLTGLSPEQVRVALRYYAEYADEIDEWLRRVDEQATAAELDWRCGQALAPR